MPMPHAKYRTVGSRAAARTRYLRERAAALRALAETIDVRIIRDRVLALAEECVQLARLVEKEGEAKNSVLAPGRPSPKRQASRARS